MKTKFGIVGCGFLGNIVADARTVCYRTMSWWA